MAMTKTEFAINDLRRSHAILENRADAADDTLAELRTTLRHDLDAIKGDGEKVKIQLLEVIKQLTRAEEGLKHLEKDLDKLRSNRFEVGKVVLAAFFSFMGAGIFFLLNMLSQWLLKLK
jgi:predicted  nucleic acid-binding Zn-ribbon protein